MDKFLYIIFMQFSLHVSISCYISFSLCNNKRNLVLKLRRRELGQVVVLEKFLKRLSLPGCFQCWSSASTSFVSDDHEIDAFTRSCKRWLNNFGERELFRWGGENFGWDLFSRQEGEFYVDTWFKFLQLFQQSCISKTRTNADRCSRFSTRLNNG